MNKTRKFSPLTIRFRRWSRKSYALACSFRHQVTIGTLRGHVADALLKRPGMACSLLISYFHVFGNGNDSCSDPGVDSITDEDPELLLIPCLPVNISSDSVPAFLPESFIQTGKTSSSFSGFLFTKTQKS